jgi:4-hydroxyphenylpyruvate dioxygenase
MRDGFIRISSHRFKSITSKVSVIMGRVLPDIVATRGESSISLQEIDYIEFYVGNACQAMHFYRTLLGFTPIAYAGLETGGSDRVSYVLRQSKINLMFTTPLNGSNPLADHVRRHGDGVKDIAFRVKDTKLVFEEAVKRGARPVMEPADFEDEHGRVRKATIAVYGDTVHSFIERESYHGPFFPHYQAIDDLSPIRRVGLAAFDHIAISLGDGELDQWANFYSNVLDFHQSHQEDVTTEYSAMNSKVMENGTGRIKFPMMEPAAGKRKSQIEEYLNFYQGPGAQHIAMMTGDIVKTVRALRENGIEFLRIPGAYYEALESRVGKIDEEITALQELNILVDRDRWGYLMQVFSKPLQGRPTLFMEIIQRKGARGFGGGNIRALFEAVEREQAKRGTL